MTVQTIGLDCPRCGAMLSVEIERDAAYPGGWVAEGECVAQTCRCDLSDDECEALSDRAEMVATRDGAAIPPTGEGAQGEEGTP